MKLKQRLSKAFLVTLIVLIAAFPIFAQVGNVGPDVTTFTDLGLNPNTTYTYRVYATGVTGNSGYSNEASATTPGP